MTQGMLETFKQANVLNNWVCFYVSHESQEAIYVAEYMLWLYCWPMLLLSIHSKGSNLNTEAAFQEKEMEMIWFCCIMLSY